MLFNIAWRNVWRHPLRSGVVMMAIALGLWAGLAMMAFSWGMSESRTRDVIQTQTSHIQIHDGGYEAGEEMQHILPDAEAIQQEIAAMHHVVQTSGRMLASGMLESTSGSFGIQLRGIDPEEEAATTLLDQRVIGGEYFPESRRPQILVGEALAKEIGVIEEPDEADSASSETTYNFRRNVVIRFQNPAGEIISSKFKVCGVYETLNANLEEMQVFIRRDDLQRIAGVPQGFQEIAILLDDQQMMDTTAAMIAAAHPDVKVQTLTELAPELEFMANSFDASMRIFIGVILLALAFGIINTMLMAVLERTRELGMLMSIGMNRVKVFSMIMLETVFLTIVGTPVGLVASWAFIEYFGKVGIDLSAFQQGLDEFGMASMVYTELPTSYYGEVIIMVIVTALVAAIFPARRALKLNPAEAVRAL